MRNRNKNRNIIVKFLVSRHADYLLFTNRALPKGNDFVLIRLMKDQVDLKICFIRWYCLRANRRDIKLISRVVTSETGKSDEGWAPTSRSHYFIPCEELYISLNVRFISTPYNLPDKQAVQFIGFTGVIIYRIYDYTKDSPSHYVSTLTWTTAELQEL